jgi:phosphatidylglycerol:prolipoprotein diacylglycerol transferase
VDSIVMAVDPVIFRYSSIAIRWYGLMIALGIAAGIYVALRESRRLGIDEDATYNTALWGVVGAIVGARLFHVVDRFDFYLQNPSTIFALQQGGLAIWGAVIGGLVAGGLYCRYAGLSLQKMADVAAPAILLGQIIGRLGCLINGDAYGAHVDLPWSIQYVHPDALIPDLGEPTHPYPLYEMLWNTAVLGIIWRMRRGNYRPGTTFLSYLVLYALGRFVLTFVREEAIVVLGLQQAQVMALLIGLAAVPLLARRLDRWRFRGAVGDG